LFLHLLYVKTVLVHTTHNIAMIKYFFHSYVPQYSKHVTYYHFCISLEWIECENNIMTNQEQQMLRLKCLVKYPLKIQQKKLTVLICTLSFHR
jgi:hypothetical protein